MIHIETAAKFVNHAKCMVKKSPFLPLLFGDLKNTVNTILGQVGYFLPVIRRYSDTKYREKSSRRNKYSQSLRKFTMV
jgi:hypothetical protein